MTSVEDSNKEQDIGYRGLELKEIFGVGKPVIAMLHLNALPGQPGFTDLEVVKGNALMDIDRLQRAGISGLLIENWKEDSISPFTSEETAKAMLDLVMQLKGNIRIPFGVNVLNNDYRTAFRIASESGAAFVQLDVLVDHVISDFKYSQLAKQYPFEINVDLQDLQSMRYSQGLDKLPIFTFIQPKHYRMVDPQKPIEVSAIEAIQAGAHGLIVTKETGVAPTTEIIQRVKKVLGEAFPVGIGSGFSRENAALFLPMVDFAIVGTDLKVDRITDNLVDEDSARELMNIAENFNN